MYIQSICSRIEPVLRRTQFAAQVESAFADACNLLTPDGAILSLVSREIGNGPLNAVVSRFEALALLNAGDRLHGDGQRLWLRNGWQLELAESEIWNPIPPYHHLAAWPEAAAANIAWLRRYLPLQAPEASLAAMPRRSTQGAFGSRPSLALVQMHAGQFTAGLLQAYAAADLAALHQYAGQLAGLGPGLTPAGDDWLAGWLVGLRAVRAINGNAQPYGLPVEIVAAAVVAAAHSRTSRLSLAFVQAAADGAVSETWHGLMAALSDASQRLIRVAADRVMAHGATSGSDMLAGFLAAFNDPLP